MHWETRACSLANTHLTLHLLNFSIFAAFRWVFQAGYPRFLSLGWSLACFSRALDLWDSDFLFGGYSGDRAGSFSSLHNTHTHTATALLYVCFCFLYPHKSHRLYNASHHFTFRRIEPALFLRSFFCSLEPQQQHTPAHIRLPCLVLAPKKSVSITSPWWISDFHALCRLLWTRGLGWIPFFMRRMG